MIGFVFCHGWGLDSSYWSNIKSYFSDYPCVFLDRGYFASKTTNIDLDTSITWFGIGHSLGFIHLLQSSYNLAGIVGLNGFTNFLSNKFLLSKQRKLMLHLMKEKLKNDPTQVLLRFYKELNISNNQHLDHFNIENLNQDLQLLEQDFSKLTHNKKIFLITSNNDPIIPLNVIQDNLNQNPHIILENIESNSHSLGLSNPQETANLILKFCLSIK